MASPDEMPCSMAFHLDLHCLKKVPVQGFLVYIGLKVNKKKLSFRAHQDDSPAKMKRSSALNLR